MVLPFIIAAVPSAMAIGSRIGKYASKFPQPLKQSAQFGLGYGASTAVGYNLIPQFGKVKRNSNKVTKLTLSNNMAYGKIRVWSRKYRRYIWVYPRNYGYGYRRRGYRSYRR